MACMRNYVREVRQSREQRKTATTKNGKTTLVETHEKKRCANGEKCIDGDSI